MKAGQLKVTRALFAALFYVFFASVASAAGTPALSFTGGDAFNSFDPASTVGWRFTVNEPTHVLALGWWDAGQNGLEASHEVGLWKDGGALLAQVTVGAGMAGTLEGSFRYQALTPPLSLVLAPGIYRLGGFDTYLDGDTYMQSAATVTVNPLITFGKINFDNAVLSTSDVFAFPDIVTANYGRFGPNMLIAAVPEPSTYALMLVGLGFVGWVARRNRKSQQVAAV